MYESEKEQSNHYLLQVKNIFKIMINKVLNTISLGVQQDWPILRFY